MSSSPDQVMVQFPAEPKEDGRKPFVFKRVLNEARQDPKEIIADFSAYLRKTKALFLVRESREPGCISLTYRREGKRTCFQARYAYSSHQWVNAMTHLRQRQCGLLHLGSVGPGLNLELIKENLQNKSAHYLIVDGKLESKEAKSLSSVVVYANEALYYVDLRSDAVIQLIDEAAVALIDDILTLERGDYTTASEAQLELIARVTNIDRHKKLTFTQVDRESIADKGDALLKLLCEEYGLNEEQMLLPNKDQVADAHEFSHNGYQSSCGIMQQLEQQLEDLSLQPMLSSAAPKRKRLDESENINPDHRYQFFPGESFLNRFSNPLSQAIDARKRGRFDP